MTRAARVRNRFAPLLVVCATLVLAVACTQTAGEDASGGTEQLPAVFEAASLDPEPDTSGCPFLDKPAMESSLSSTLPEYDLEFAYSTSQIFPMDGGGDAVAIICAWTKNGTVGAIIDGTSGPFLATILIAGGTPAIKTMLSVPEEEEFPLPYVTELEVAKNIPGENLLLLVEFNYEVGPSKLGEVWDRTSNLTLLD